MSETPRAYEASFSTDGSAADAAIPGVKQAEVDGGDPTVYGGPQLSSVPQADEDGGASSVTGDVQFASVPKDSSQERERLHTRVCDLNVSGSGILWENANKLLGHRVSLYTAWVDQRRSEKVKWVEAGKPNCLVCGKPRQPAHYDLTLLAALSRSGERSSKLWVRVGSRPTALWVVPAPLLQRTGQVRLPKTLRKSGRSWPTFARYAQSANGTSRTPQMVAR